MNPALTLRGAHAALAILLVFGLAPAAFSQILGTLEADDHFSYAVAVGDFNGDGEDDLAVGAHDEDLFVLSINHPAAGAVNVIYGTEGDGLDDTGNQFWTQNSAAGTFTDSEDYDAFGQALAAGDFDNDGYDDLAIGVPGEEVDAAEDHGAVTVLYGSSAGLTAAGSQFWSQVPLLIAGTAEENEAFGSALAAGDFDGDGYDDLAVGVPFDNVLGGPAAAGAVNVLNGSAGDGLSTDGNSLWHQDRTGVLDTAESGDRFGAALTTGDFDGDGYDDLAVGGPYEDIENFPDPYIDAGTVNLIFGTAAGLSDADDMLFTQSTAGVGDDVSSGDRFGAALASGDFKDDGFDDLAIGTPGEDYGSLTDVGQVHVLYGKPSGVINGLGSFYLASVPSAQTDYRLAAAVAAGDFDGDGYDDLAVGGPGRNFGAATDAGLVGVLFGSSGGIRTAGYQVWHQNITDIPEAAERDDAFGHALAVGDFDSDQLADLAVGVPGESIGTVLTAGAVHVLYGVASTGLTAAGNQLWYQGGTGSLTDDNPDGEPEIAEAAPSAVTGEALARALLPAAPNPFRDATTLRFTLPAAGSVRLAVYDALGRAVAVLADGPIEAGTHAVLFDGRGLPGGVYLVRMTTEGRFAEALRVTLVK